MSADEKDCITVDLSGLVFESNEGSSTQQGEGSAEKANEGTKSNTTVRSTLKAPESCLLTISIADNDF